MSDPTRLLHGAAGPLVAELIAAGRDELPSDAALQRTLQLAALAAGAAATLAHSVTQTAQAASAASGIQAAGSAAALTGGGAAKIGVSVAALSKWVGIAAVGIGVSSAVPSVLRWVESAPAPASASRPLEVAERTSAPIQIEKPELPREAPTPAPGPAKQSKAPKQLQVSPAKTSARSASLELRLVDSARDALQSGDAARALELLEPYETSISERQFELEVAVLRMEALARLGRTEPARRQARLLLERSPSERQAARARVILNRRESFE